MKIDGTKPINILLVEDSDDDIVIIQRAFKKVKLTNDLHIVCDGQEALDFIFHEGKYAEIKPATPGLILLDINMPKVDGFGVLKKLKANPPYNIIPVVMLTVSDREEDVVKSFKNGAVSYITKPMDFEKFTKVIETFEIYWTLVSKVPVIKQ
jgi:CheY-like chemotaxis protein